MILFSSFSFMATVSDFNGIILENCFLFSSLIFVSSNPVFVPKIFLSLKIKKLLLHQILKYQDMVYYSACFHHRNYN